MHNSVGSEIYLEPILAIGHLPSTVSHLPFAAGVNHDFKEGP
jgi:hypothetical protein